MSEISSISINTWSSSNIDHHPSTSKMKQNLPPVKSKRKNVKVPVDLQSGNSSEISNSDHIESVTTNKSEVRSYKEKLKERYLAVKRESERAKLKAKTQNEFRNQTNSIVSLNKCIEIIKKENTEVDEQFQLYKKGGTKKTFKDLVSKAEKYNFFCEVNLGTEGELLNNKVDDGNESTNELLNKDEGSTFITTFKRPEQKINDIIENEKDVFWIPSGFKSVEKDPNYSRNLSEEGIYIPKSPRIPSRHLNILNQRLLADEDGSKWLNCEGELDFIEEVDTKVIYRPDGYAASSTIDVKYQKPTCEITDLANINISKTKDYNDILEVHIYSLKFTHHALFSAEHVLQEELIKLYDKHRLAISSNGIQKLEKKLCNLRKKIDLMTDKASGDHLETNPLHCLKELQTTRDKYLDANKVFRNNMKRILYTWKSIKQIRVDKNFSSTPVRLIIKKTEFNPEEDKKMYNEKFELFFRELIKENQNQLDQYKKELTERKENLDDNITSIERNKPIKPRKLSAGKLKNNLFKQFEESFRQPGEPLLQFNLIYDNQISKNVEDSEESNRRNILKQTKIYFKIILNEIQACKSKMFTLTENFTCLLDETYSLKLLEVPKFLNLEIYEKCNKRKYKLGDLELILPSKKTNSNKLNEKHFVFNDFKSTYSAGVGVEITLNELSKLIGFEKPNGDDNLYTKGFVTFTMNWDSGDKKVLDIQTNVQEIFDDNGMINAQKLKEWVDFHQPDPQDPRNSIIFDYLKNCSESSGNESPKYFRCDPHLYSLNFGTRAEIDENVRFQLLQLRERNEPEFVGMIVPNRIKEIPINIFSTYQRRLASENPEEYLTEDDFDNEISSRRSFGRKYLKQLHTKMFQICKSATNNLCYEDVVDEKVLSYIELYIKTFLSNVLNWFKIQPTMNKPLPIKSAVQYETEKKFGYKTPPELYINLLGGINLPKRKQKDTTDGKNQGIEIRSFVQVSYQNEIKRSTSQEGCNPTYNEQILIHLEEECSEYLSPNSQNGIVYIHLFDEYEEQHIVSSTWIGSLEVPIGAILQTGKAEGMFLVQTPEIIFNYEISSKPTFLIVSFAVDSNLPKLLFDPNSFPCSEPVYLKDHIVQWNKKFNEDFPKRRFSALVVNSSGNSVCATRFIKPLELPQINQDGFDMTAEQCVRYVSMIPFTSSNKYYQNLWLTSEQLLKFGLGSVVDHAIALACYFMTLKIQSWVLLGFGIPHGTTGYVLVREFLPDNPVPLHYIYDVVTCKKYNIMDTQCPLQKIYCVLNDENIWGNNQNNEQVSTTRFEFSRRFDWTPLFNNNVTAPTNSIQTKLIYTTAYETRKIEVSIEKKLRKKCSKLRKQERTIWNPSISSALKNVLAKLEKIKLQNKSIADFMPDDLIEYQNDFEISGAVLNVGFSSTAACVNKVINTDLLLKNIPNSEFASGVFVQSYSNQIISVWIACLLCVKK